MLKYQIGMLMVFKGCSQYCINTDLYMYNIEKNPSISSEYYYDTLV